MADNRIQRPIRASQPPTRSAPSTAPGNLSGNDPLAELARLIGQNDPFAEYGRETARRAAQQHDAIPERQEAPEPIYHGDRYAAPVQPAQYAGEPYPPQQYGVVPGYAAEAGYEHEAEYSTNAHLDAEDHDFYDDVPPRRRLGILAIAAVFALAVIGTAGAFGYRAMFGASGAKTPPPVIKADSSPTKIVPPANSKDPKSGKLIYDRVAERGQDEKIVSREEQPVEMKDKPAGVMPQGQVGTIQRATGSGVVTTEPKKIHTIAIRPDGTTMADAAPAATAAATASPAAAQPPARGPAAAAASPHQTVARAEPPPHHTTPPPSNAPLSLNPDAQPSAQAAPAPRVTRTAVAAPTQIAPTAARTAPASNGHSYAVQVSSQRSEAEAQAAFRSLQAKFPSQLGGKQPLIHRVDLGAKGIYFRAMVGPMASEEASHLCSNLKAAGGQCIVQRN